MSLHDTGWQSLGSVIERHHGMLYVLIVSLAVFYTAKFVTFNEYKKIPIVNPRSWFDFLGKAQKMNYVQNGARLVRLGRDMFPGTPFRLATVMGSVIVLPGDCAHDVRNNPDLSFKEVFKVDFHVGYPGFEPYTAGFAADSLLIHVIRKHLTKHADIFNQLLSAEISFILNEKFGSTSDWKEIRLRETLLDVVVQSSVFVFLGPEACPNPAWLSIVKSYGINSIQAAHVLRLWPKWLRGVANKFLPSCKQLQRQVHESRSIVDAILRKRRALREKNGRNSVETASDLVDWFEEESAGRPYDLAAFQLMLSVAAMNATFELVNEVLVCIADHQELVDEIRNEIAKVLPIHGFTKAGMFNLMLLDSVIKESQRHKSDAVTMNRIAARDVKLSNGIVLKKGQRITVSTEVMFSADVYEDPMNFDGYRHLRARSAPGQENLHQLTSSTATELSWGFGKHACPGRFFVSNEVKLILIHIIMKYDFKLAEGYIPHRRNWGTSVSSDPESRIVIRKRIPELDLSLI